MRRQTGNMYHQTKTTAGEAGLRGGMRLSNLMPDRAIACRHTNIGYWTGVEYLGARGGVVWGRVLAWRAGNAYQDAGGNRI